MAAVIQACDVGVIRSTSGLDAVPTVLAALGDSSCIPLGMAFLDITVFNVALPAVQADLEAAAAQAQGP